MKQALILFSCLLLAGCAKQTSPTGGPKDETPPELINSNPEHKTVNFKETKVELTFSELIQLNKPKEEIIISPAVKETETTYKKNKVFLAFKTKLQDSTTYSINFREAIQDLTEKNPAVNLKLAFSTGSYIDSLSLAGRAFDLLTNKPLPDITVAVHYKNDTFNIFKHKSEILTKTDVDGNFLIENLRPASYTLYAFNDKNKNLIVDSKSEKYGFLPDNIELKEKVKSIQLPLISLDARALKLISARPYENYFNIQLNKSLAEYKITYPSKQPTACAIGEDLSSILLYQTFEVKDSIATNLFIRDSVGNQLDTLLYVKFNAPKEGAKFDKFNVTVQKPEILLHKQEFSTKITFNKPLKKLTYDSIYYSVDSLTHYIFTDQEIKLDTQKLLLTLTKKLPLTAFARQEEIPNRKKMELKVGVSDSTMLQNKVLKKTKELVFGFAALISIDNDSSAAETNKPTYYKEEDLGITLVEAKTNAANYFVEILNSQGKVVQRVSNKASLSFLNLVPGEYLLRLIIDKNRNGKWDAGNYFLREEPEPVYYYADENGVQKFSLKANWELGPLLIKDEYSVNNLGIKSKK